MSSHIVGGSNINSGPCVLTHFPEAQYISHDVEEEELLPTLYFFDSVYSSFMSLHDDNNEVENAAFGQHNLYAGHSNSNDVGGYNSNKCSLEKVSRSVCSIINDVIHQNEDADPEQVEHTLSPEEADDNNNSNTVNDDGNRNRNRKNIDNQELSSHSSHKAHSRHKRRQRGKAKHRHELPHKVANTHQPILYDNTDESIEVHKDSIPFLQEYLLSSIIEEDKSALPTTEGEPFLICVRLPQRKAAVLKKTNDLSAFILNASISTTNNTSTSTNSITSSSSDNSSVSSAQTAIYNSSGSRATNDKNNNNSDNNNSVNITTASNVATSKTEVNNKHDSIGISNAADDTNDSNKKENNNPNSNTSDVLATSASLLSSVQNSERQTTMNECSDNKTTLDKEHVKSNPLANLHNDNVKQNKTSNANQTEEDINDDKTRHSVNNDVCTPMIECPKLTDKTNVKTTSSTAAATAASVSCSSTVVPSSSWSSCSARRSQSRAAVEQIGQSTRDVKTSQIVDDTSNGNNTTNNDISSTTSVGVGHATTRNKVVEMPHNPSTTTSVANTKEPHLIKTEPSATAVTMSPGNFPSMPALSTLSYKDTSYNDDKSNNNNSNNNHRNEEEEDDDNDDNLKNRSFSKNETSILEPNVFDDSVTEPHPLTIKALVKQFILSQI